MYSMSNLVPSPSPDVISQPWRKKESKKKRGCEIKKYMGGVLGVGFAHVQSAPDL